MARGMQKDAKAFQLPLQTADLVVAFMVWVILSTLLPFIRNDIALSSEEAAWVIAIPVLLGSALRIPFGYLAGRYGAFSVYVACFAALLFPIGFIGAASSLADLVIGGIFLGIAGAVFSVGVTSLPRYYPVARQGFVNGVYGVGNIGTALTTFLAPSLAIFYGWRTAITCYLVLVLVILGVNILFGDRHESRLTAPFGAQFKKIYRQGKLWIFSLFYFVSFGAFVALTMLMPNFLVDHYMVDGLQSGIFTGVFIVLAAFLRIVGGWLADRRNPYRLLLLFFGMVVLGALVMAGLPDLPIFLMGLYIVGLFCGLINGVVFKLVPAHFSKEVGLASGFVSMMGGFGGFFPPLILSFFFSSVGVYTPGFLLFAAGAMLSAFFAAVLLRESSTHSLAR